MYLRNDYWAYLQTDSPYLMHYGVKGMKWGVRHDYVPTGRYRYIHRNQGTDSSGSSRSRRTSSRPQQYATPQQRRIMNRIKIAKAAAITTGVVAGAVGAYKWSKVLKSPVGKRMIADGKRVMMNKYFDYSNRAHNVAKLTKQVAGTPLRAARSTPVGRVAGRVLSAPKRVIGGSRAGKMALRAYGTAVTLSDINSTQQWVRRVHKNGKVTGSDVKDLAKDLINPLPDNVPLINKRAREERRRRRNAKRT